jgi:hypothetical protein
VRTAPTLQIEENFWLHRRGAVPAALWAAQNAHGRRWYARHARDRPADRRPLEELAPRPRPGALA